MRMIHSTCRTLLRCSPLLVVACASVAPAPPRGLDPRFELVQCRPGNPAMAAADVDADGDVLRVRGHAFTLPRGAVAARTPFQVRDRHTGHLGVDIEPHGTRFQVPAQLTISYARCSDEVAKFRDLRIVEVRPGGTEIVGAPLASRLDPLAQTITADIEHLSGYLVGGNRAE